VMAFLDDHLARSGATLVLVTHDEELAGRLTHRIVRLRDGQVVGEAPP
jgi:predicted ABC-type transport system involved in lysophospholipase L1 biosynthesis ATPase subunit